MFFHKSDNNKPLLYKKKALKEVKLKLSYKFLNQDKYIYKKGKTAVVSDDLITIQVIMNNHSYIKSKMIIDKK